MRVDSGESTSAPGRGRRRRRRRRRGFPFEDFTLVLSRSCNLACEYCPLDHLGRHMGADIVDAFFPQLLRYADREVLVTLFGGEPLLNRPGVERYFDQALRHADAFADAGGAVVTKIVTNGLLLDGRTLETLARAVSHRGLGVEVNISIDGGPGTQLRQRPVRGEPRDYFARLAQNVVEAKSIDVALSLGMVAGIDSPSLVDDFVYLCDTFELPVFVMPVDLTYKFITQSPDIALRARRYMRQIRALLTFLHGHDDYGRYAVNLQETEDRDLKLPPLGPTVDWDGAVYVTRDFLFTMDHAIGFQALGTLGPGNLHTFVDAFGSSQDELAPMVQSALETYMGRTLPINKKIGDYFTRLVYQRPLPAGAES